MRYPTARSESGTLAQSPPRLSEAMQTLHETEVLADPLRLVAAWRRPATFALLPERTAVDRSWLDAMMGALPKPLREGCFALLTSGSTGRPKLVLGQRRRTEALARVLHEVQDGEAARSAVVVLPLSYSFAFVNQLVWSQVMDRPLVVTPGLSDPATTAARLDAAADPMVCLVGPQVPLLDRHFPARSFPNVVRVHFAGGPFPAAHIGVVERLFPHARIFNNYGCAEAMPRLTVRPWTDDPDPGNVGPPIPGVELRSGEDGRLEFRSPYRIVAYSSDDTWHEVDDDAWLPSGDHGQARPDGSWTILGRSNEVFKRFGEKISLHQLLGTVQRSWEAEAAFYREDDAAGEAGFVLLLAPDPDGAQLRAILQDFRRHHPRTHWPLRVESVRRLPRLANGKLDLAGLPRLEERTVHWRQRI